MNFKEKKYLIPIIIFISYLLIFVVFWKLIFWYNLENIKYSTEVYDRNNIYLWEKQNNYIYHKKWENYSEFLKKSIIAIEDKRFYYHNWIDLIAILRATKNNLIGNSRQWASTIQAQIIRNTQKNSSRNYQTKALEFLKWYWLKYYYTKDEILNLYLNNVNFEKNIVGFKSAWEYYFWKDEKDLTKTQIIALITIINNPNYYSPYKNYWNFAKRFEIVKNKLITENIISKQDLEFINIDNLKFEKNTWKFFDENSNYFLNYIKTNEDKFYSTIDLNLTKEIKKLADSTIYSLKWKNVWDYWVIVIDTKNMDLLTMIWWVNYSGENWQVNSTTSLRQAWSTLKPFLYLQYFKEFNKNWNDKIIDAPVWYETQEWNLYSPKNYTLDYKYEVSLKESLSQSLNIPAVKILQELWINNFIQFLKNVWIDSINKEGEHYWLSLALWSAEIELLKLTQAYWIFFNDWDLCKINIKKWQKTNCKNIISKEYIKQIYEILSNRYYKLESFWVNSELDFQDLNVFFKTWTSRNFRDNWVVWWIDNYLIWVWVWNKDWSEMKWVSWASWAWNIFKKIIYLLKNWETQNLNNPDFSQKKLDFIEITNPLNFTTYKLDELKNNISPIFKTNIDYDNYKWFLNWKILENNVINFENLKERNSLKIEIYKNNKILNSANIEFRTK